MKFIFYLSFAFSVLSASAKIPKASSPIANRVNTAAKHLPLSATLVAKYTDNRRHCLYYIYQNRLYCFDVKSNKTQDINFETNNYSSILRAFSVADGNLLFIAVERKGLTNSYITDGQVLWGINTFNKQSFKIGEGYDISKHKDHFLIKKGARCLNSQAPQHRRKWMIKDHYFYLDGKPMFVKEEYLYRP